MTRRRVDNILLSVSIFGFLLLAISFLLMPVESKTTVAGISIYSFIAGIMFWVSIVLSIVTQCILAHRRKKWYVINRVKKVNSIKKIGLFSFFKNTFATIADIIAIISLIGLIVAMILMHGTGYICFIFISVFVFSFSMHCVLNGKIYYHVINQNKMLQALKKERANLLKSERVEENA